MAKKPKRQWGWAPDKRIKPAVTDSIKTEVQRKAEELIEEHLKPEHVKAPPEEPRWNYLTGLHAKWHGAFFTFIGEYACSGPDAISPTLESPFARLEYTSDGKLSLAYMRHTGKWWQVFEGLTLDEALELIQGNSLFHPA